MFGRTISLARAIGRGIVMKNTIALPGLLAKRTVGGGRESWVVFIGLKGFVLNLRIRKRLRILSAHLKPRGLNSVLMAKLKKDLRRSLSMSIILKSQNTQRALSLMALGPAKWEMMKILSILHLG